MENKLVFKDKIIDQNNEYYRLTFKIRQDTMG